MGKIWFFVCFLFLISCGTDHKRQWEVSSPSGNLHFHFIHENSRLYYLVTWTEGEERDTVVRKSPLGLVCLEQNYAAGLSFDSVSKIKKITEAYVMRSGKQRECFTEAYELTLYLRNLSGYPFLLTARAYNDGVAFRYELPGKEETSKHTVVSEQTGFYIPSGKAWMIRYDAVNEWAPAYEKDYKGAMPVGSSSPDSLGWALPALFHSGKYWMLVTEAGLDSSYCGIHLQQHAPDGLYLVRFPEENEGYGVMGSSRPISSLPFKTPWRVIVAGKTPGVMVETNLVYHLSAPCELADTSWIKPGKVSWSWWGDHESPCYESRLRKYIDLASQMKWEYSLIDAGWHAMKEGNIENVIRYAASKGVGILLWYNSGGPHNRVMNAGPRDLMHVDTIREREFERISRMGVKGVKVDFFQSDKQQMIKLYLDILKSAARYHLLVDFHGCTIPRGWSRTYPNLMTMEAVSGAEQYSWDTVFADNAQTHHTILPFTRNAIGPMDYTPVTFSHYNDKVHHKTTWAHELALTVVFESGLQHIAERAETFNHLPVYVLDFLRNVPAAWDETRFICGEPEKEIVLARRKGQVWYIAGLNGEKEGKVVKVDCSFIEKGKVTLIKDGTPPSTFSKDEFELKEKAFEIYLAPRGGFAGIIR